MPTTINLIDIATLFKALGDPTRLRIFEFLRSCQGSVAVSEGGDVHIVDGPTVGAVCCHVTGQEGSSSAISFHLKELRNAGLIRMEKHGKYVVCAVDTEAISRLHQYFEETKSTSEPCC